MAKFAPSTHSRRLSLPRLTWWRVAALSERSGPPRCLGLRRESARKAGLPLPAAHFRARLRTLNQRCGCGLLVQRARLGSIQFLGRGVGVKALLSGSGSLRTMQVRCSRYRREKEKRVRFRPFCGRTAQVAQGKGCASSKGPPARPSGAGSPISQSALLFRG